MAGRHLVLLPGFGGAYTSDTFVAANTATDPDPDTLDCSHHSQLSVQINSIGSPTGNIDFTQSFNGTDYAAIIAGLTNLAVTTGTTILLDESDGPFGVWKIDPTDITAGSVVVTITGFGPRRLE